MTALLLSAAGSAMGGLFGPIGAMAGRALGAMAGSAIDQSLFGRGRKRGQDREGPRLDDLSVQGSSEGAPIPVVYGMVRVTGEVIWATRHEETRTVEVERGGGKGLGRTGGGVKSTTYSYFANVAVGLCEGPIAYISRIWVDGKPLDLSGLTIRMHFGTETQSPDPLIQAKHGTPDVPAYRGLAYVVFERLPIAPYGNRIPQFSFEVVRPLGDLEKQLRGVCLIPGATEFGYHTREVRRVTGLGASATENAHTRRATTDAHEALDMLQALAPGLTHVAVVVGWFGTDLRVGQCQVKPGVDIAAKETTGDIWRVCGVDRAGAHVVSRVSGAAAYGGTPSDASLIALIGLLKERGLSVSLIPFLFMDIPYGNTLPNPQDGAVGQWAYPWRGRITCDPAPGRAGSPDGTNAVIAGIDAFFGAAAASDFDIVDGQVVYGGPQEWSWRRAVLHCATIAKAAGGVEMIVVGSEFRQLTTLRSDRRVFPAAQRFAALAADVKAIPNAASLVTYAADWSEYGAYAPPDRPNDLLFPLDAIWSSPAIDRVGVDWYAPVSDWRDGDGHLDASLARSIQDRAYLHARLEGGEGFDWYYADMTARHAQNRAPITDGAYGKPWVYRPKDLKSWWSNSHVERLDGVEVGATGWVPGLKPIRFVEVGCGAVDKGPNQPNLFYDAKSVESGAPWFSNGGRDDALQRRFLEVVHDHYDPGNAIGAIANPLSPLDGRRMVEHGAMHVWCWDARPYPSFPARTDVWSDGWNWRTGHWLNGRLGQVPIAKLIETLGARFGGPPIDTNDAEGLVVGYKVDRRMSGRAALEPLALAFGFDIVTDGASLRVSRHGAPPVATIGLDDLAVSGDQVRPRFERDQETEIPSSVTLVVSDAEREHRRVAVSAKRSGTRSLRESRLDLAAVMPSEDAERRADMLLRRRWAGRETASIFLPPSRLAIEPGDVVRLDLGLGAVRTLRVDRVERGTVTRVEARGEDRGLTPAAGSPAAPATVSVHPGVGRAHVEIVELPCRAGGDAGRAPLIAATAAPWPGALRLWRPEPGGGHVHAGELHLPAVVGTTLDTLGPGPSWRFDRVRSFRMEVVGGTIDTVSEAALLDGANLFALRHPDGRWEALQAGRAELVAAGTYRLSVLLRGQVGTEHLAAAPVPAGARVVLLNETVAPLPVLEQHLGASIAWRVGPVGVDAGHETVVVAPHVWSGIGMRPWAPARARARRTAAGIEIAFTRRLRFDGDPWDYAADPAVEAYEAYLVEVMQGGAPCWSERVFAPMAVYPAAREIADFGTPQPSIALRVRQENGLVGLGEPLTATLSL
jgi:hypothetical protein